jgi:hypothetical protein
MLKDFSSSIFVFKTTLKIEYPNFKKGLLETKDFMRNSFAILMDKFIFGSAFILY